MRKHLMSKILLQIQSRLRPASHIFQTKRKSLINSTCGSRTPNNKARNRVRHHPPRVWGLAVFKRSRIATVALTLAWMEHDVCQQRTHTAGTEIKLKAVSFEFLNVDQGVMYLRILSSGHAASSRLKGLL
jgi:hypothetical protein